MRNWAEEAARDYLLSKGYELLAENYSVRGGEIDLVMRDGEEIVFVEVRQRGSAAYGDPGETIDSRKLLRLRRAALIFLAERFRDENVPLRFDALLIHGSRRGYRLEHVAAVG